MTSYNELVAAVTALEQADKTSYAVFCHPDRVGAVQGLVDRQGWATWVAVYGSSYCEDRDQIFLAVDTLR